MINYRLRIERKIVDLLETEKSVNSNTIYYEQIEFALKQLKELLK
jgi:hypothetical protein